MITFVLISCGRLDLLERTVKSFMKFNTYRIDKYLLIDDSAREDVHVELKKMFSDWELVFNEKNIGEVASIDKIYSLVNTEYIFHCEDDWEFMDSGFVEKSLTILGACPDIMQVWISNHNNHPILSSKLFVNGVKYRIVDYAIGTFGLSWNPGLRKKEAYDKIAPFIQYSKPDERFIGRMPMHYLVATSAEWYAGKALTDMGYRVAILDKTYCKHIGGGNSIR
jgi:hypothetical protein